MPKLIPVADELSKPFWDAVNEKRLVLQHCGACNKLQYPPQTDLPGLRFGRQAHVERGERQGPHRHLHRHRGRPAQPAHGRQPYNLAMVTLDEDPTINFYSNLPGTPPYKVPVGAAVEVTFEEVAPSQLIHEWRVVE